MTNEARRVGSQFETDTVLYLREQGLSAERLPRAGRNDQGDILIGQHDFIAELKARRDRNSSLNLHAWLGEAEREAECYRVARNLPEAPTPILVVKNPRHKIEDSFVVLRLKDFIDGREEYV